MADNTPAQTRSPYPEAVSPNSNSKSTKPRPSTSPDPSHSFSSSSSSSESEGSSSRRSRVNRPRLQDRQKSSSFIIPKGSEIMQTVSPQYPSDDARAMSPRRNSQDMEELGRSLRKTLKDQARTLQSSLAALAERIDEVKLDHDKLESENKFLQDYIGGLTRTMSRGDIGSTSGKGKK